MNTSQCFASVTGTTMGLWLITTPRMLSRPSRMGASCASQMSCHLISVLVGGDSSARAVMPTWVCVSHSVPVVSVARTQRAVCPSRCYRHGFQNMGDIGCSSLWYSVLNRRKIHQLKPNAPKHGISHHKSLNGWHAVLFKMCFKCFNKE